MEVWKLHTLADYLNFLIVAAFFILVVYLGIKKINKSRNDESAAKKVAKLLKTNEKKGILMNNVDFELDGKTFHFDHLLLDNAGIVAMRTIGWGTRIYGSRDEAQWTAVDNKDEKRIIENPIAVLESGFEPIKRLLSKAGIYNVSVIPLAIFADPFDTPELYLGRDSDCIVYNDLKGWKKQRVLRSEAKAEKKDRFDFAEAAKCLQAAKKN